MIRSKQHGLIATPYLVLVGLLLLLVAFGAAKHYRDEAKDQSRLRQEAVAALNGERELRRNTDKVAAQYAADVKKFKGIAHANRRKLLDALSSGPDCNLPAAAGGVLRDLSRDPAPAAAAGAGGTAAQGDSAGADRAGAGTDAPDEGGRPVSCRAISIWSQSNIDLVLKPNSAQLERLQQLYESTREKVNAQSR